MLENLSIEGWKKDEELLLELSKGGFGRCLGNSSKRMRK